MVFEQTYHCAPPLACKSLQSEVALSLVSNLLQSRFIFVTLTLKCPAYLLWLRSRHREGPRHLSLES